LADLQRAKNEQQIQIAQAQSRYDAAELNKKAAVIEAEAVALQIQAIGSELKNHDLYLRWQWIQMMEKTESETNTIYVPTEANLPVLEAGRLGKRSGD
jgi:regulator of protease activity HflC (stomatin/prohibitin superfamily)